MSKQPLTQPLTQPPTPAQRILAIQAKQITKLKATNHLTFKTLYSGDEPWGIYHCALCGDDNIAIPTSKVSSPTNPSGHTHCGCAKRLYESKQLWRFPV